MNKKYFSFEKNEQTATLNIYGDITSFPWNEGDVSSANLSKQLETMKDVSEINVYINSYGGEVAEGLAIYNALKRHKAKIRTFCDGFAASIASVIFMAGDERVMNEASLLMIHNAWTYASGNAEELRKQADDLEKITQASVEAYKANSSLSEEEIKALMNAETWILPEEALSYGFATSIDKTENKNPSQNAFMKLFEIVKAHQKDERNSENESNIVCVTGPPCSGKSTYVRENIGENDAVFDYDSIMEALTTRASHEESTDAQHQLCLYLRKAFVSGAKQVELNTVWVIATRPNEELQETLGECEYINIDATETECMANLEKSNRPNKELWEQRIKEYFEDESADETNEERIVQKWLGFFDAIKKNN